MKNCLCCGKPLPEQDEKSGTGWHQKCIRKFFGTEQLPELDLSPEALDQPVKAGSWNFALPEKAAYTMPTRAMAIMEYSRKLDR